MIEKPPHVMAERMVAELLAARPTSGVYRSASHPEEEPTLPSARGADVLVDIPVPVIAWWRVVVAMLLLEG